MMDTISWIALALLFMCATFVMGMGHQENYTLEQCKETNVTTMYTDDTVMFCKIVSIEGLMVR